MICHNYPVHMKSEDKTEFLFVYTLGVVAYGSSKNATLSLNLLEQWEIFFTYGQWLLIVETVDIYKISNQNFADQGNFFLKQKVFR